MGRAGVCVGQVGQRLEELDSLSKSNEDMITTARGRLPGVASKFEGVEARQGGVSRLLGAVLHWLAMRLVRILLWVRHTHGRARTHTHARTSTSTHARTHAHIMQLVRMILWAGVFVFACV